MAGWANSTRRDELPADWPRRRRIVLNRDKVCRCDGCEAHDGPCTSRSTDVDHLNRADHRLGMLQGLCGPCHLRKTIRERPVNHRRRPSEAHPGMTPGG